MALHTILLATLGACAIAVHPAPAQQWVEPGTRIRVSGEHAPRFVGRFIRRIGDTLEVAPEHRFGLVRLPLGQVKRIEVSRGRSTGAIKGMILGTMTGASGLGLLGLGSGFFVGAFFTVENWGRAELRPDPIGQDARGAAAGLRLRVAF